jgi:tetratricopeptide (TPR) repeat protein
MKMKHLPTKRIYIASLLVFGLLSSGNLIAQDSISPEARIAEKRYGDCLTLARKSPDKGINAALEWQFDDGGAPARHCEALGLFFAGEYGEAAVRLERIAEDMRIGRDMPIRDNERVTASARMLADIYGQAANAWLLADEIVRADAAIQQALGLVPPHTSLEQELQIDMARIAAADEDYALAFSELEKVLARNRNRVDILLLLASAARGIENFVRADSVLATYMAVYPNDPAAHLELGNLRDVEGKVDDARQAWLKVLSLTETGPSADAARANLERIDVHKGGK